MSVLGLQVSWTASEAENLACVQSGKAKVSGRGSAPGRSRFAQEILSLKSEPCLPPLLGLWVPISIQGSPEKQN